MTVSYFCPVRKYSGFSLYFNEYTICCVFVHILFSIVLV